MAPRPPPSLLQRSLIRDWRKTAGNPKFETSTLGHYVRPWFLGENWQHLLLTFGTLLEILGQMRVVTFEINNVIFPLLHACRPLQRSTRGGHCGQALPPWGRQTGRGVFEVGLACGGHLCPEWGRWWVRVDRRTVATTKHAPG